MESVRLLVAFGSPKASHTASGKQAVSKIEREADSLTTLSKAGRCTAATVAYAEMHRAIGTAEAHMRSGGGADSGIWIPQTTIREASYQYNEHCVRESRGVSGAKQAPSPVYGTRKGPPPGVPIVPGMRGARRKRRR